MIELGAFEVLRLLLLLLRKKERAFSLLLRNLQALRRATRGQIDCLGLCLGVCVCLEILSKARQANSGTAGESLLAFFW